MKEGGRVLVVHLCVDFDRSNTMLRKGMGCATIFI
jgi:hypothetical protein